MLLNDDIIDIEKPDGICSLIFDVDEFSEKSLFSHTFYATQVCFFKNNKNHDYFLMLFLLIM